MPAVHRLRDICSGHACYPPRPNRSASSNVKVNSRGWHRKGDGWQRHCCCSKCRCHTSVTAEGSSSVFVNSRPAVRIGDPVKCGSAAATGSTNVYCGG
jgi:uncharacterized Zn-binding protein involved in type VI secretion